MYGNNSILEELKYQFRYGGVLTQLVLVNVAVWVVLIILGIVSNVFLAGDPNIYAPVKSFISVPSGLKTLATRFWTPFTYMFVHEGALHILFNMLWLWWFGRIFTVFLDVKKILPIYLMGGLAGAFVFVLLYNTLPVFKGVDLPMIGASASVMAVVFATVALSPDYSIRLLFFGDVRIKYIALVMILFDLLAISNLSNTGGHFAHLGGAAMGFFLMRQLQNGNDWISPVNNFFDRITGNRNPKPRVVYRRRESVKAEAKGFQETVIANIKRKQKASLDPNNMTMEEKREKVDEILDKIKEKGYDNLSKEEREFLFTYSNES